MNRLIPSVVIVATIISGLIYPREEASAQTAKDLVGTWSLVSVTVEQGGQKRDVQGPNPKGLLMLDSGGHFAVLTFRADQPKFASNNRLEATAEESKALLSGTLGHYGTSPWPTTYWCFTSNAVCSQIGMVLSRSAPSLSKGTTSVHHTRVNRRGAHSTGLEARQIGRQRWLQPEVVFSIAPQMLLTVVASPGTPRKMWSTGITYDSLVAIEPGLPFHQVTVDRTLGAGGWTDRPAAAVLASSRRVSSGGHA